MARTALDTRDIKTEQRPDLAVDPNNRPSEIIAAGEDVLKKEYADELAFNEEPITIMIQPPLDDNAPDSHPVWVNGTGAECWDERNKRWVAIGYLPFGRMLIVKRKYVAVLIGSKTDAVKTASDDAEAVERARNVARRITRSSFAVSVMHDPNPRGAAWLQEVVRRNMG